MAQGNMEGSAASGYRHVETITPSNSTLLDPVPVGIYIGDGVVKNVAVVMQNDTDLDGVDHTSTLVGGTGYRQVSTTITDTGGGTPTERATYGFTVNPATGAILEINVLTPGKGYSSAPTIVITDTGINQVTGVSISGVPGSGASATAVLGVATTITSMLSGIIHPLRPKRVMSSNTTATLILGLY